MLDESLPTWRFKPSSETPLNSVLYFTHQGSDASAEYLLKRPTPSEAPNRYAIGLLDAQYVSVIYGEVLLEPNWTQPTLSAAEIRAANGATPPQIANTPDTFAISLYNPDQSIPVKLHAGSWGKTDAWEFEIPERTFKLPSTSRVDQDTAEAPAVDLVPKVVFKWKRDGRLSRDMTCYMCGRSVGGNKSKEPDITVAMFRGKNESTLTIYEPNMARVEIEDRKGLEVALLLSAEAIRDLYLNPRQDPFNTAGGSGPVSSSRRRTNSRPVGSPTVPAMTGALGNIPPTSPTQPAPAQNDARRQAEIDAETRRLQAMVAEEERQAREREKREQEEQKRIKKMLEKEDKDRRRREAEIEKETERLRKEYGVQGQDYPSPQLPPRPTNNQGTWASSSSYSGHPSLPPRPNSVGPAAASGALPPQTQMQPPAGAPNGAPNGKKKTGLGGLLQGPYGGPAGASVSGFFGRRDDEERRKKVQKKRSVHF